MSSSRKIYFSAPILRSCLLFWFISMSFESASNSGHESFVRALARYEKVIRAYIRGAGISRPEDVDEIIQEVFVIAWQKFNQLENVEEFPRWACVIARYRVLEFRRNRFRDRLVLSEKVFELLLEEALPHWRSSTNSGKPSRHGSNLVYWNCWWPASITTANAARCRSRFSRPAFNRSPRN